MYYLIIYHILIVHFFWGDKIILQATVPGIIKIVSQMEKL